MGAIRIEPGVQFQAAFVGLGDGEPEGVVVGGRGFAEVAGQVFGPGFDLGIVEGVAAGADLEDDRIEVECGGAVEDGEEFFFLLVCSGILKYTRQSFSHVGY